jgi:hypothetical protein
MFAPTVRRLRGAVLSKAGRVVSMRRVPLRRITLATLPAAVVERAAAATAGKLH